MNRHRLTLILTDRRGVALPMALLTLLVLSALVIGFSVLAATEPTIANNQLMVAQARAVAEAGMERAIWALNNPADANGIPDPLVLAPAPYNGSQLVAVAYNGTTIGGFRVTVANGAQANERNITADGWAPSDTANLRGKQRITVTVNKPRFPDPPAGLSVRGEVQIGGGAQVDSRSDTSCGPKLGVFATDDIELSGNGKVWGADGNSTANQATDYAKDQPTAAFDVYAWSNAELDALKAIARSRNTYYQGTVTFNAANPMPNGLIFVDTTTGANIDIGGAGTTPTGEFANVTVHGSAPADVSGVFHGWLVVNGSLAISGAFQMQGLIYSQNDLTYMGTGNGQIQGAVMTRNIRDTSSTNIDTDLGGNSLIVFNCSMARTGGGQVPTSWLIKGGTYREVSG